MLIVKPTHVLYDVASNNTNTTYDLKPTVIPYTVNQPADSQLWNGNFCSISIFGINEYLEGNAKNIMYSLHKIMIFVRWCKLEDKTAKNILQISEFSFVA